MSIRSLTFLSLVLLPLAACDKPVTKVTYQHLANCPSYNLDNKSGSITGGMFQVFMLRGVVHPAKASAPFSFSLNKVNQGGITPGYGGGAFHIMQSSPLFLPIGFGTSVAAGAAYTVPYGQGELFVIANDGADSGTKTFLNYESSDSESVLMTALDPNAAPWVCNVIDESSLNTIHSKQNGYDNGYTPDGKKK